VRFLADLSSSVEDREVILVEDIVDTGRTISYLLKVLEARGANSLEVATLLNKPSRRIVDVPTAYTGFEIEDRFVVGYGMDFEERYRNLPYIGILDLC
jgi:hypoxanthine phosphoribosyltransferase